VGQAFAGSSAAASSPSVPALASPAPGFLNNAGINALRKADGKLLFAHSDLSGYSVFEEAAWWGYEAARKVLG